MRKYILPHLISSRVVKSKLLTTSPPSLKCGIAGHSSHCLSASLAPALSVPNRIKYLTWSVGHLHSLRECAYTTADSIPKKHSLILSFFPCHFVAETSLPLSLLHRRYILLFSVVFNLAPLSPPHPHATQQICPQSASPCDNGRQETRLR